MIQLFTELQEKKNVRSNLSALRASLKEATEEQKAQAIEFVRGHEDLVFGFLQEEDAKTRKNAALLLGDLAVQNALQPLWKAYTREQTLFVKSAYLEAMKALHAEEILFNLFSGRYQIFCHGCNLVVNILIQTIQIRINTVKKTDPECDGSHIQILLLDHFVGFLYFPAVNHSLLPPCFRYDAFFQKFLRADI